MECFLNGSISNDVGIVSILLRRLESGIRWTVIKKKKTLAFTGAMIQFWSVRLVERRSFTFGVLSNPPPPLKTTSGSVS